MTTLVFPFLAVISNVDGKPGVAYGLYQDEAQCVVSMEGMRASVKAKNITIEKIVASCEPIEIQVEGVEI